MPDQRIQGLFTEFMKPIDECVYVSSRKKTPSSLLSTHPAALPIGRLYSRGEQASRRMPYGLRHEGEIQRHTLCSRRFSAAGLAKAALARDNISTLRTLQLSMPASEGLKTFAEMARLIPEGNRIVPQ